MSEPTNTTYVINQVEEFQRGADNWGYQAERVLVVPEPAPEEPEIIVELPTAPSGLTFIKPVPEPEKPDTDFDEPENPEKYSISTIQSLKIPNSVDEDVSFTWNVGTYEPGPKPEIINYTPPTVTLPVVDPAPEIVDPGAPDLSVIEAPHFDGITLPSFNITLNPANLPTLTDKFKYSENPYSVEVLDEILTEVRAVIGGRLITPAWIWNGFWSRGAGNLKRKENADVFQARKANAILGHEIPSMVMFTREASAINESRNALNELTRENVLQQAVQYREDFWKALEQGYACEELLERASSQRFERLLRAAVEANNAGIAVYNAAIQAYQITEIAAKDFLIRLKDLELRGSLAELDEFDRELAAAGFLLEYDKNKVELYKAQWSGEESKARAYAAYVDGIKAYVDAQRAAVEAYGIQVQTNNTKLEGWNIEWDAYTKRLEPSRLKIAAHEARNSLFANRVQYYQARAGVNRDKVTSDIDIERLGLQSFEQELNRFRVLWEGIQTKLQALTQVYSTDAAVYSAKGSVETARISSQVDKYRADIERANLDLQAKIETARRDLQYWQTEMDTFARWQASAAGTYSQLGAAAYAAANISLSAGSSVGYGYDYNYSEQKSRSYNVGVDIAIDEASGVETDPPEIPTGPVT